MSSTTDVMRLPGSYAYTFSHARVFYTRLEVSMKYGTLSVKLNRA